AARRTILLAHPTPTHSPYTTLFRSVAGAHAGDDADAHAPDGMGHYHGHRPCVAGLPRLVRRLRDAAVRQDPGNQLFHAGHCRDRSEEHTSKLQSRVELV